MNLLSSLLAFTARQIGALRSQADSNTSRIGASEDDISDLTTTVNNTIVANSNSREVLWTATGGAELYDGSIVLSKNISNFDFIDIEYKQSSNKTITKRIPAVAGSYEINDFTLNYTTPVIDFYKQVLMLSATGLAAEQNYEVEAVGGSDAWTKHRGIYQFSIVRVLGVKLGSASPSELTDIRVGADGTTYDSAGNAVRGQLSDLKSEIDNNAELYVNGETVISPHYLNKASSGGKPTVDSNIRLISDKIYMPPKSEGEITQEISGVSVVVYRFDGTDTLIGSGIYASNEGAKFEHCDHIRVYAQYNNNDPITPTDGLSIATLKFYYVDTIAEEVEYLSDVKQTIYTKQLYDRNDVVTGYYMNVNGGVSESSSYMYTPKIDVSGKTGSTLYFSVDGVAKGIRFLTAFDSSGNPVSASGVNDGTMETKMYTIPNGIDAVIITTKNQNTDAQYKHFQVEWDAITTYEPVYAYNRINPSLLSSEVDTDILKGKKWAVCGDSFTEGVTNTKIQGGKYDGMHYSYPYLIGARANMNILKFFRGGKTLANPSDGTFLNSLTNPNAPGSEYYQNIPADVDYITIYLGINDGNHDTGSGTTPDGEDATGVITLGTIDDVTTESYYGAWNVVMTWLLTNRPNAHIGIIISNGCKDQSWMNAQKLIAQKYGVPYLDLNGDERCRAMIRSLNPNIPNAVKNIIKQTQAVDPSTNTHPNDAAHLLESTFIENFLRSL